MLIALHGERVGQVNGLTQIDLGDYRFGLPVRLTAHAYAGEEGLLNIEREVEMSGPIHDKGVFILQTYLAALFAHLAPLSLNASIVFEQEYHGVEGDSASCAELYALLSCAVRPAAQAGHRRHRRGQPARRGAAGGRHQRKDRGLFPRLRGRRPGRQPGRADPRAQPPPPDAGAARWSRRSPADASISIRRSG